MQAERLGGSRDRHELCVVLFTEDDRAQRKRHLSEHLLADRIEQLHSLGVRMAQAYVSAGIPAGNALMKSFKRLGIDPLSVYGTICLKCPVEDPADESPECIQRVAEEFNIVQPRIMVVMGDDALEALNGMEIPLSRPVEARLGEIQAFTPACDVLVVPDIDESLDEEGAKRRFWRAFRTLGRWHDDLPPY